MADAEAQGCHGGTAMVQARIKFKPHAITEDLPLGVDLHSMVFSLCLHFYRAYLFICIGPKSERWT